MSKPINYFILFGLSQDFDVDTAALRQRYRALQSQAHPDRTSNGTDSEKRAAVEQSALLNEGYQVLSQPVARAKHLFELQSGTAPKAQNLASEPAFLMLQIDAREQLELFKEEAVDEDQLEDFIEQYESLLDEELSRFKSLLASESYAPAEASIAKLQLFTKLLSEASEIEQAIE